MIFRLMLKLAGVMLIGLTFEYVLREIIHFSQILIYTDEWFGDYMFLSYSTLTTLAPIIAGLYLLFGGEWMVNCFVPLTQSYCVHCGYRLTGTTHARCPECGVVLSEDAPNGGDGDGDDDDDK